MAFRILWTCHKKENDWRLMSKEQIIQFRGKKRTAEDVDALVVASASLFCFRSCCDERLFALSVLSSDSRGDRAVVDCVPGACFCSWLSCVCTCVACFCNSAAAATASLCFFNSKWWRSWARISRSNWRASRASRSFCYMWKISQMKRKKIFDYSAGIHCIPSHIIPSNAEPQVRRA